MADKGGRGLDAGDLRYDLAIDASGRGEPSAIDAGFAPFGTDTGPRPPVPLLLLGVAAVAIVGPVLRERRSGAGGRLPPMAGA